MYEWRNVVIDGSPARNTRSEEEACGLRIASLARKLRWTASTYIGAHVVKNFADQADGLVLAHMPGFMARYSSSYAASTIMAEWFEKADFVTGLDEAGLRHQGLSIDDFDSFFLQSEEYRQFDDVDADRFFVQAAHFEFDTDFFWLHLPRDPSQASWRHATWRCRPRDRSPSQGQCS